MIDVIYIINAIAKLIKQEAAMRIEAQFGFKQGKKNEARF
jgi:hypothetical protein